MKNIHDINDHKLACNANRYRMRRRCRAEKFLGKATSLKKFLSPAINQLLSVWYRYGPGKKCMDEICSEIMYVYYILMLHRMGAKPTPSPTQKGARGSLPCVRIHPWRPGRTSAVQPPGWSGEAMQQEPIGGTYHIIVSKAYIKGNIPRKYGQKAKNMILYVTLQYLYNKGSWNSHWILDNKKGIEQNHPPRI